MEFEHPHINTKPTKEIVSHIIAKKELKGHMKDIDTIKLNRLKNKLFPEINYDKYRNLVDDLGNRP